LVHTLKSNAGQLKKTMLKNAAQEIEDALKDGENLATPEQWSVLKNELETVLQELTPIAEEITDTENNAEKLSEEETKNLFQKIKPLLDDNNPDCLDYVEDLKKIPGTQELIKQIEDFDFEKAAKALEKLF